MQPWAIVPAGVAPVALIGGSMVAASRQPEAYSSVRSSISALAAQHATDRWIMTAALAVVGICYVATAIGLTEAGPAARALFVLGGAATVVVASSPQPDVAHVPAAGTAFVALAIWPVFSGVPSRRWALCAAVVMVILLGWFGFQLAGSWFGLTERFLADAEALWPLGVAAVLMWRQRRAARDRPARAT